MTTDTTDYEKTDYKKTALGVTLADEPAKEKLPSKIYILDTGTKESGWELRQYFSSQKERNDAIAAHEKACDTGGMVPKYNIFSPRRPTTKKQLIRFLNAWGWGLG